MQVTANRNILALDVGAKRIGLALANTSARLAKPLTTLIYDGTLFGELTKVIEAEQVEDIIVGLPRGLDGQETEQTEFVRSFVRQLEENFSLPVYLQDEAVTSRQAEEELKNRGKPYAKGDIDALAAAYILEDFLRSGDYE